MSPDGWPAPGEAPANKLTALVQARAAVAKARAQAPGHNGQLALALYTLAKAERDAGHQRQVVLAAEEALLTDDRQDPAQALDLRLLLAQALSELLLDAEALREANAAFDAARQARSYTPTVRALSVLGALYGRMGDHDNAHELLMQALSRARELQDAAALRAVRNNLVGFLSTAAVRQADAQGRPPSAQAPLRLHATALWASLDEEPDTYRRLTMGVTAAYGLVLSGDLNEGLSRLQACTDEVEAQGFETTLMKARGGLARAHLLRHEPAQARDQMLGCLDEAQRLGNGPGEISAHEGLVIAWRALGDEVQAERHAQAVAQLTAWRDRRREEARSQIALDRAALRSTLARLDREWAAPS